MLLPGSQRGLHFQEVHHPVSRFTAFGNRRDQQVRAANDVATGEDFRVAGLERVIAAFWRNDAALRVQLYAVLRQPLHAVRTKTKRHHHGVSRDHVFRTGHDLRATTAFRIWRTHLRARHLHAAHFTVGIHFNTQRLDVELELDALFTCVFHFALRARHVLFVTTVGTDDMRRILANGGTHAVHRGITAAQHHHAFAFHADERLIGGLAVAH